ncbi:MAG: HIT family protein [Bacilli bacterium]|jgi:histidine triad (HIT) family protein|nr:HIT family protein [Bacilli bacterium]
MANKHNFDPDCIFCKIADGKIPCLKIYEDEDILAFLDISPSSKGHALVITKEHFANFLVVPHDLLAKAYEVAQKIGQAQVSQLGAKGCNIITNVNEIAGQSVKHFHIHVIPRYDPNDGLELNFKPKMIEKLNLPVLAEEIKKGL